MATGLRQASPPGNSCLLELLVELSRLLQDDYSVQAVLRHLVARAPDVLPIAGAAVMVMDDDGEMQVEAASDDALRHVEGLQLLLEEGPGLHTCSTGIRTVVSDLTAEARFPRFGAGAAAAGFGSVCSFPIQVGGTLIGVVDLYRPEAHGLATEEVAVGQTLADVAAAYVVNALSRHASEHAARTLRFHALHDPLTGLPNRLLVFDRITQAVARASRDDTGPAVLFVDLDGFKAVNDCFGHETGDRLLVAVATRLKDIMRKGDTLGRLGGDEFLMLLEQLQGPDDAALVAGRITAALAVPFVIDEHTLTISASIGIACGGDDDTCDSLVRAADLAMYQAKKSDSPRRVLPASGSMPPR